jgi:hypothetical protein
MRTSRVLGALVGGILLFCPATQAQAGWQSSPTWTSASVVVRDDGLCSGIYTSIPVLRFYECIYASSSGPGGA